MNSTVFWDFRLGINLKINQAVQDLSKLKHDSWNHHQSVRAFSAAGFLTKWIETYTPSGVYVSNVDGDAILKHFIYTNGFITLKKLRNNDSTE